jgi:hypothetical protein
VTTRSRAAPASPAAPCDTGGAVAHGSRSGPAIQVGATGVEASTESRSWIASCTPISSASISATAVCGGRRGREHVSCELAATRSTEGIIAECAGTIESVRGRAPYIRYERAKRLATLTSYWRAWPCLFPQHGPGRKHHRRIALAPWQQSIVDEHPEPVPPGADRLGRMARHEQGARQRPRLRISAVPVLQPVPGHQGHLYADVRPAWDRMAPVGTTPHLRRPPGQRRVDGRVHWAEVLSRTVLA